MISSLDALINLALKEDIGSGDITANALIPIRQISTAVVRVKEDGVIAGLFLIKQIYRRLSSRISVSLKVKDGSIVAKGTVVAVIRGPTRAILTGERTVLNFLQRLSGIATLTNQFVNKVGRSGTVKILDTRKTAPGWRMLDKYAVKMGGGVNHRMGLFDAVLIKDNHLKSVGTTLAPVRLRRDGLQEKEQGPARSLQTIVKALDMVTKSRLTKNKPIEIEITNLDEFIIALVYLSGIKNRGTIMLDNITVKTIKSAVNLRNKINPRVLLEVSGGVTLNNIGGLIRTGVNFISVGMLTHSVKALDITLKIVSSL